MKGIVFIAVGEDSYFFRFPSGKVEIVHGLLRCCWLGAGLILRGWRVKLDEESDASLPGEKP